MNVMTSKEMVDVLRSCIGCMRFSSGRQAALNVVLSAGNGTEIYIRGAGHMTLPSPGRDEISAKKKDGKWYINHIIRYDVGTISNSYTCSSYDMVDVLANPLSKRYVYIEVNDNNDES